MKITYTCLGCDYEGEPEEVFIFFHHRRPVFNFKCPKCGKITSTEVMEYETLVQEDWR